MSDAERIEWPREIWMAEREDHDQGIVSAVLSEWATVARFEGDTEREKEFHRYVDGDIYDSADKYWRTRVAALTEKLATARQLVTHATTELAQSAQDMNAMRAERALHKAIRALANEAET